MSRKPVFEKRHLCSWHQHLLWLLLTKSRHIPMM